MSQKDGFAKMSDEQAKMYKDQMETIEVPEGHMIIFFENIIHEVSGKKYPYPISRLFVGFVIWTGAPPCTTTDPVPTRKPCGKCRPCIPCPLHTPCNNRDEKKKACILCRQFFSVSPCGRYAAFPPLKSGQNVTVFPKIYKVYRSNKWRLEAIMSHIPSTRVPGSSVPSDMVPAIKLPDSYPDKEHSKLRGYPLPSASDDEPPTKCPRIS